MKNYKLAIIIVSSITIITSLFLLTMILALLFPKTTKTTTVSETIDNGSLDEPVILIEESMPPLSLVENPVAGKFSLSDFSKQLSEYQSNKTVSPITSIKDARNKAITLWSEDLDYDPLGSLADISIQYDSAEKCWYISGELPPNSFGFSPHALICDSGKVLAIWMD